jgi:integrase
MERSKPSRAIGRLSARKVATAKAGMHHDGGGLYLQVTESAERDDDGHPILRRSWLYRYATGTGKQRRERQMGLGPLTVVSLGDARLAAGERRRERLAGKDPIEERKAARVAAQLERARGVSFKSAAEQFIDAHRAGWKSAKHAAQWGATLSTYVYGIFGDAAIADVDVAVVMKVLEQSMSAEKGKPAGTLWTARPETASRIRGRVESILDWATARGFRRGDNPARWKGHLENLLPKRSKVAKVEHHPALPYSEAGAFIAQLRQQQGMAAEALEFTILCASRTGEVIGAKLREIDVDAKVWTVPGERMKAGKEHKIPLSDAALLIAKRRVDAGGEYLFPGDKKSKPLSNMAMLKLLERMERDDVTVHGFRSTFRDWAAERTNFPREVAEMALAHVIEDKVEAAYRRGDLFEKRRQLMRAWAEWCSKPAKVAEVTPLTRAPAPPLDAYR